MKISNKNNSSCEKQNIDTAWHRLLCASVLCVSLSLSATAADAATYYVDDTNGTGTQTDTGSAAHPWKTLAQARAVVTSGDTILVANGTYAPYKETLSSNRTNWITYKAADGHHPVIKNITVTASAPGYNAYLKFQGFTIQIPVTWYAENGYTGANYAAANGWPSNPYSYPENAFTQTEDPISVSNAHYIDISDCVVSGIHKLLTVHGIYLLNSNNSRIYHCDVSLVEEPIYAADSNDISITYNKCHDFFASGIGLSPALKANNNVGTNNVVFGNHIYDQQPETSGGAYTYSSSHQGSAMAIRVANVSVRNNIIHNIFGQGIKFYDESNLTYKNMVVENNLLYDIANPMLTLANIAGPLTVRNNTIIGRVNDYSLGLYGLMYRYGGNTGINLTYVPSVFSGSFGSATGPAGWTNVVGAYDSSKLTYAVDSSYGTSSAYGNPLVLTLSPASRIGAIRIKLRSSVSSYDSYARASFRIHSSAGWSQPVTSSYLNVASAEYATVSFSAIDADQIEVTTKNYGTNGQAIVPNYIYSVQYDNHDSTTAAIPVSFYNNIVVGPYELPDPCNSSEHYVENYNIWYRGYAHPSGLEYVKGDHSKMAAWYGVVAPHYYHGYQEYFEAIPNRTGYTAEYPQGAVRVPFFVNPQIDTAISGGKDHGTTTADYRLASTSPAVNFGDASNQPVDSLGTIGPDGFIRNDGPARDASRHSAGCYEFGAAAPAPVEPPVNNDTPTVSSLVGFWKFDENAGSVAADSSGVNNNGTLVGATWCQGRVNTALSFNGVDNYVNMGSATNLNLTGSLTVIAWILPVTYGQNGRGCIVHKGTATNGFSLYLDGSTASLAYMANGAQPVSSNANVIELGKWQHIAAKYDAAAGLVTFYVNGQVAGTAAYSTNPGDSSSEPLLLGYSSAQAFDGLIDDAHIYNKAQLQKTVSILYVTTNKHTLDITSENGSVTVSPQMDSYYSGYNVTLTAVADDGYEFSSWAGDLAGTTNPVKIVMDVSKTIEAVFTKTNTAPVFVSVEPRSIVAGSVLTFTVQAADAQNDAITYTVQNLPAGASFDGGTFSWRPLTAGSSDVIFAASDGQAAATMTVTITVLPNAADGLVLWTQMDDSPADGVLDSSSYGNNGTSASLPSLVNGYFNNGYSFDGVDDYVSIVSSVSLNLRKLTLGAWICPREYRNDQRIISKEIGRSSPYTIYSLLLSDAGEKKLQLRLGIGNVRKIVTSRADIPLNTWTHVAATFDGITAKLYINGQVDTSVAMTGQVMANKNPVYIGACQFYPWFFSGIIDDAVIYNRALTASEIAGLMLANNNAPVLAAISDKQVAAGQTLTFQLAGSDVDGNTLSYSAANMPAGASLNGNVFTWTPNSSQTGLYSVTFAVSDGQLSATQAIVITVTQ